LPYIDVGVALDAGAHGDITQVCGYVAQWERSCNATTFGRQSVPRIHFKAIFGEVQVVEVVAADPFQHVPRRARMSTKLSQRMVVLTLGRRRRSYPLLVGNQASQRFLTDFGAKRRHPPVRSERKEKYSPLSTMVVSTVLTKELLGLTRT
jgi:hypothetical protein